MRLRSRVIPAVGMLLCAALFVYLGAWQAGKGDRLAQALAQQAQRRQLGALQVTAQPLNALEVQDAPLRVVGNYDPAHQIFLDNRQHKGQPGVHVITPLKIEGSDTYILVNRVGWAGNLGAQYCRWWPFRRGGSKSPVWRLYRPPRSFF